ncbi:MAG: hypothetical protein CVU78_04575 [Elusimicrobia bacterium HGW-Elusimicrobia-2]|nr:MAG: hypothetical protein CVU78_04575 [Elusimicrobia bacterium HGW-Elusimicrobia-2]
MKIYLSGLAFNDGKVKYNDERLIKLSDKFKPKKVAPFFAEFTTVDPEQADALAVMKETLLDLLIPDMEKLEGRLARSESQDEKKLLVKCIRAMEEEKVLCDLELSGDEKNILKALAPLTFKPTVVLAGEITTDELISRALKKAGIIFFYTAGKDECKAWPVEKNSNALTCAGKIHSDLARGFIRADVVPFDGMMGVFNMHEAKEKGLVKTVEKNHIIEDGDIIEIKFNV